jgi:hypothetical protein
MAKKFDDLGRSNRVVGGELFKKVLEETFFVRNFELSFAEKRILDSK